ncbi:MAG: hypothetical protein R3D03_11025 [Geminicoccaceae bacterium]
MDKVFYDHIFIGLVSEIGDARTIGDAVMQVADAADVLLVVGPGEQMISGRRCKMASMARDTARGTGAS